jgi:hypothetical protein
MANKIHTVAHSSDFRRSLPVQHALKKVTCTVGAALFLTVLLCKAASAEDIIDVNYIYHLTDFDGALPLNNAKLYADQEHHELYAIGQDFSVRIFNGAGMETYKFNDDNGFGKVIIDVTVDKKGNILLLSTAYGAGYYYLLTCDYRGELLTTLELKNIPNNFGAGAMVYRDGKLYLVDRTDMRVIVMDEQGKIEKNIDLFAALGVKKQRSDVGLSGFSLDKDGSILFTVPVLFQGFRLSPDGKLVAFGQRGSSPGKFNVTAGIITDDEGHYFVADKLKCAVLIFDKDFNFITQVGYRGFNSPGGLIVPSEIAYMDKHLYVSSGANQGVSVFEIGP